MLRNDVKTYTFDELVTEFFDYRSKFGKTIEGGTIPSYKSDLDIFRKYMTSNNLPFNLDTLKKYIKFLKDYRKLDTKTNEYTPLCPQTIARRKASLSALIRFGNKEKHIDFPIQYEDVLYTKKRERKSLKPHKALDIDSIDELMLCLANENCKDQLKVLIPLFTNSRGIEVTNLTVSNFNFATGNLDLVITKNGIPRSVPIPEFLIHKLKKYIRENDLSFDNYIFPSNRNKYKPISERTLRESIEKLVGKAKLNRTVTPHDLRATYCTNQALYGDVSIKTLQKWMGHEDINTTAGYFQDDRRDMIKYKIVDLDSRWSKLLDKKTNNNLSSLRAA